MIQDLLHARGSSPIQSINEHMVLYDFMATYSAFPIVALLISSLPPGSQGVVRDVAEAYHTVPIHPS